jgi:glutamate/aspartate transport system substrate-binding protein
VRRHHALIALAAFTLGATSVRAEEGVLSGTIKTIRDRGTILIGYRTSAPPFAFLNKGGQPIGFSIDICHGIAVEVASTLNSDLLEADAPEWQTGIRIKYVPVPADARLPMLVAGTIDLECGSTTANADRAKTIAFSPVFFLAGTKLMVPRTSAATSYRDLAGKTIAVGSGTTNDPVIQHLASSVTPAIKVSEVTNLNAAYDDLVIGKADAFASDDILLSGFLATRPDGKGYHVIGDYLSYEPYAIGFRRDDPAFADLIKQSFQDMASFGSLSALYARWFVNRLPTGETMDLPMSAQLTEMYRALGQPD